MSMLVFTVSRQVMFSGAVTGITYGVMAVGVVLIYRSSRVINLAIAEMGGLAAAVLAFLVINHHVSYWVALPACVGLGAAVGALIERVVVRRLFDAPRVLLLVATIGVSQLLLFAQASLPDPARVRAYPTPFARTWTVFGVFVRSEHVVVLVVVPLITIALASFLGRTRYGLAIRAAAANPSAARLAGISVRRMSTIVWALAGAFSALGTILAAPFTTSISSEVFTLGPGLLVRVLAAALVARMASLPVALAAGVGIGMVESVLFYNNPTQRGLTDVLLLGIVIAALLVMSRRGSGRRMAAAESWSFAPRSRPVAHRLEHLWVVRHLSKLAGAVALVLALVPFAAFERASQQFLWSRVLIYALAALSLTVLTGWAGQLSLGQAAFAGLGAMTAAAMIREGIGPGPVLLAAAAIGAGAAIAVGIPALRMPGLFLSVSTLALAVASSTWILSRSVFLHGEANATLPRLIFNGVSLESQRLYYLVCLGFLMLGLLITSRLRRSGIGRSFLAVRDNEQASAALGLSPTRVKLTAFGVSGAIAGISGALLAELLVTFPAERFSGGESLRLVSIAVIGGLSSVVGTVLGAAFVVGLPALFPDSPTLPLLTSGAGLLVLLLWFPGGLEQVLHRIRDRVLERIDQGREAAEPGSTPEGDSVDAAAIGGALRRRAAVARPATGADAEPAEPARPAIAVSVHDLRVRFASLAVVDGVDLEVRAGEVVGLIGSNGAGKSTLMNAIGGFVPSTGRIELLGEDVSGVGPSARARRGLGRTFQGAELFGDLTVRETVQVALHARHRVDLFSVLVGLPRAGRIERAIRAEAEEIIGLLGLGRWTGQFVSELSTGTRRIVELACLFALRARVLCLDEPTAGIAQRESEAFGPLILQVRQELDASMLVIEHDLPVIMAICDRLYCLETGRIISEGQPDEVRHSPAVIASYLGTDEVAIQRSGGAR